VADVTVGDALLQSSKGRFELVVHRLGRPLGELRLGIVDVVQVDTVQVEVRQRPVEARVDESRRDGVLTPRQIFAVDDSRLDVLLEDVLSGVSRPLLVEWDEPALGRDERRFPVDFRVANGIADDAFARWFR